MRTIPELQEGTHRAKASGTLPNGKPVIVNADGTVSVVEATTIPQAVGSSAVFESATTGVGGIGSTFDSSSNKIVIAYRDGGNSNYSTAVVGTVSGTSISFGTPTVFESSAGQNFSPVFDSNANKVVIAYTGANDYGRSVVGTVSGTSITFGSSVIFYSGVATWDSAVFDSSNNKIVIAYKDNSNSSIGRAVVGTVSGSSISYGSAVTWTSSAVQYLSIAFDSSNSKVVISSQVGTSGQSVVGTVSGTSISFGSTTTFETGSYPESTSTAFDSINNKIVVAWTISSTGKAIVGTVSGTSISFGTAVSYASATTTSISNTFDSNTGTVVVSYRDEGNSNKGTFVTGTVSGTDISFTSPTVFEGNSTTSITSSFDSNSNKVVISYQDAGNSNYGTARVVQPPGSSANLTAENYIGMSGGVVTGAPQSVGSAVVFESAEADQMSAVYDADNQKVVIAYRDRGNSNYGTAIVGTVSGTSISFGTAVVFESASSNNFAATYDSNAQKVVVAYTDAGNSSYGTAIVGTVSGTSISFGSATVFKTANASGKAMTYDSSAQKVVVAYRDLGNSDQGSCNVGTVSGTSISFGSDVIFEAASTNEISATFDSSGNKVVIAYSDEGNSNYGTAIVGTVSGTSISFGTAVVFETATATEMSAVFDSNSDKVVVAYKDAGNSFFGTAIVGTVSGTSISFGTAAVFQESNTQNISAVFDSNTNKVIMAYRDGGESDFGKVIEGTVSGTSISFGSALTFESSTSEWISAAYDTASQKTVIAYQDDANSQYGNAIVFQADTITRGSVADGSSATVDIIGSLSTNQSGLTAGQSYYVQTDGTIGETADDPSVFAGTAISATSLVVKT